GMRRPPARPTTRRGERGSSLEPRPGGVVAAVDLAVAVLAGAPDHPRAGRAAMGRGAERLVVAVEARAVPHGDVVALLAEVGPRRDQEVVVVGSVGLVAVEAAFAHRRVLPEERSALLGVA